MRSKLLLFLFVIFISKILAQGIDIKPRGVEKPNPSLHSYQLKVVDYDNNPIVGANVKYLVMDGATLAIDTTEILDKYGIINCTIKATYLSSSFETLLHYKITQDGYYSAEGSLTLSSYTNDMSSPTKREKIILYKPDDYLNKSFLKSAKGKGLKNKILSFIDLLRLQSLLSDSELNYGEIEIIQFKNKPYLTLSINSTNVYNEIKLNRYDIGKEIFDVIIRKILNPLNDYLDDNSFVGYDIKVSSHSKNFIDKAAITKTTEYRFLLPKSSVKKYKDKDISGQKLLDDSIILMDDERIDLKLQ